MTITQPNHTDKKSKPYFATDSFLAMPSNVCGSCLANDLGCVKKPTLVHIDDASDDKEG